jgi:hypothetical protein
MNNALRNTEALCWDSINVLEFVPEVRAVLTNFTLEDDIKNSAAWFAIDQPS